METKICGDCGETKVVSLFHKTAVRKDGSQAYFRYCKDCARIRARAWYSKNLHVARSRGRQVQRERRALGLNQERERWYKIQQKYGVSREEWEATYQSQGGACAICRKELSYRNAHTDHDHATGSFRGLLCIDCNHGIGKFRDDPEVLMRAAMYVTGGSEEPDQGEGVMQT